MESYDTIQPEAGWWIFKVQYEGEVDEEEGETDSIAGKTDSVAEETGSMANETDSMDSTTERRIGDRSVWKREG